MDINHLYILLTNKLLFFKVIKFGLKFDTISNSIRKHGESRNICNKSTKDFNGEKYLSIKF